MPMSDVCCSCFYTVFRPHKRQSAISHVDDVAVGLVLCVSCRHESGLCISEGALYPERR